jgi:RNA polymerase sigma factor (sigma-70 family)
LFGLRVGHKYTYDMTNDDMALVQEYARSNSEQAFATLVSRHINLVYSVALRQVHDAHLAEDVTQGVFIVLARKAKSLSPKTILSGWLCRTARYVSANTLSVQRRRQCREEESHMESILNEPESGSWNQIAPLLDEALNCLGEKEHDAIVLRFFDARELKEVGTVMGITEDAARMRVNRGLEKLRKFFARKGTTLSTVAIAGAVSANAVQAAPAGLAAAITAVAVSGTAITTASIIGVTKAIAMTTLQKSLITATVTLLAGTGIYEARQSANARAEVQALQQRQAPLTEQIQQLQLERDETARQLASLRDENERLNRDTSELLRLRGEVGQQRAAGRSQPQPAPTNVSSDADLQNLLPDTTARLQAAALAAIGAKYPGLSASELEFFSIYMLPKAPNGSGLISVTYSVPASAEEKYDDPKPGQATISTKAYIVALKPSGQLDRVLETTNNVITDISN